MPHRQNSSKIQLENCSKIGTSNTHLIKDFSRNEN